MWDLLTWPFQALGWMLGLVIGLLLFGLWAFCVFDCIKRRFRDPNHKWMWLAALFVTIPFGLAWLAAVAYLVFGRQQAYR